MIRVCSLRTGRWGLPLFVLAIGCAATAGFAWQATSHQQTVAALDLAIQRCPRSDTLIAAVSRLLPLLENDEPRSMSKVEYQIRANWHRERFQKELEDVRTVVRDQRDRCGELTTSRRRRNPQEDVIAKMFIRLDHEFQTLADVQLLADISPLGSDSSEAPRLPPLGEFTKRSATIEEFRKTVHEMIAGIRAIPDPAAKMMDQFYDAQLRVVTAWRYALLFAIAGTLAALAVFYLFERSFWRPLQSLRRVVEGIANRRYGETIKPRGAPEIVEMFDALSAIRERGKCSDDDREKEVADRSKQRVRSERLAGIGLLATSVAHEINNPLTAIVGAADGLTWRLSDVASKLPPDDAQIVREYLGMIVSESKRCRAITTKLLDFARGREGERAQYDITAIVNEVVGMFRHLREYASRTVDVNRHDPVRAFCNGPEIKQVVLNLVANALQATPDGGRLDIRISSTPDAVEVVFIDTGSG
ncbi:MAG TPA: histidine kinase dimerization/phospho-acceptor domain-containing protein, partial [Caulifigura sp.]|nr:histidine kinase dimerization/phospho-acceptor domain-containing protein [Caulifigura sp.]